MVIPARGGAARISDAMMSSGYTVPVTLAVVLAAALAAPTRLAAQVFADPQFGTDVVASLPQFTPTGIDWSPDGRMFILQKHGVIRVVRDGVLLPTPFLDISHKVNVTTDSGLLGIAFHPDFSNNGFVYLAYVFEQGGNPNDDGPKISRIVRVRADPANPDVALPGSETVILGGCQTSGPGADCLYVDHGHPYGRHAALRPGRQVDGRARRRWQHSRRRPEPAGAGSRQSQRQDPASQRRRDRAVGQPVLRRQSVLQSVEGLGVRLA